MILKNKVLFNIPVTKLTEQISSRRKAKDKLPLYYETPGMIYPAPENLEQSSSQATAAYKSEALAGLIPFSQATCADLTGGFGVDAYFFSKNVQKVCYVEPDLSLLEIAQHNHKLLGATNIEYHSATAEEFLGSARNSFDFIYVDPSRRTDQGKKIHALADCFPDVLRLKKAIFEKTSLMLIKASPLLDIQAGIRELDGARKVFVVSVKNECRELLFLVEKDYAGITGIEAVNLSDGGTGQSLTFTFQEEQNQRITYCDPLRYLYEPNASILKAGAFKSVGARFNLKKISANTHLYTGSELIDSFPGRKFEVDQFVKPDPASVRGCFPEGQANITTRNYPLTVDALKKRTGLRDGGEKFLIGFSGERKKFLVVARRL